MINFKPTLLLSTLLMANSLQTSDRQAQTALATTAAPDQVVMQFKSKLENLQNLRSEAMKLNSDCQIFPADKSVALMVNQLSKLLLDLAIDTEAYLAAEQANIEAHYLSKCNQRWFNFNEQACIRDHISKLPSDLQRNLNPQQRYSHARNIAFIKQRVIDPLATHPALRENPDRCLAFVIQAAAEYLEANQRIDDQIARAKA